MEQDKINLRNEYSILEQHYHALSTELNQLKLKSFDQPTDPQSSTHKNSNQAKEYYVQDLGGAIISDRKSEQQESSPRRSDRETLSYVNVHSESDLLLEQNKDCSQSKTSRTEGSEVIPEIYFNKGKDLYYELNDLKTENFQLQSEILALKASPIKSQNLPDGDHENAYNDLRLKLEKEFEENFKIERRKFKKKLESVNSEKEQVFGEVKSLVKRLEAEISTLKKEKGDLKNILVRLRCENLQILDGKSELGRAA